MRKENYSEFVLCFSCVFSLFVWSSTTDRSKIFLVIQINRFLKLLNQSWKFHLDWSSRNDKLFGTFKHCGGCKQQQQQKKQQISQNFIKWIIRFWSIYECWMCRRQSLLVASATKYDVSIDVNLINNYVASCERGCWDILHKLE